MKRLLIAPLVVMASLLVIPAAAHADPGGGAFHAECTNFPGPFSGATGGEIIITPHFNINANCRYPGPADGGGAEHLPGTGCVITPAGNFQCNPSAPAT
jgi:hypothetical protein